MPEGSSSVAAAEGDAPTRPHPGFFLVLDGPDGGGKTTQVARLADWLRGRGLDVVTCRDPGGTALGDRLRGILLDRHTLAISLPAEMLLFMASRAQLVNDVIGPALRAGCVVISDRFTLANIVYQGYAGDLGVSQVDLIGQVAARQLRPDLTLILDVPPELARSRVGRARDRMEDRSGDYHERVREGFLAAARESARFQAERADRDQGRGVVVNFGAPEERGDDWSGVLCSYSRSAIRVIDASAGPDEVFEQIRSEVERVLALDTRA